MKILLITVHNGNQIRNEHTRNIEAKLIKKKKLKGNKILYLQMCRYKHKT